MTQNDDGDGDGDNNNHSNNNNNNQKKKSLQQVSEEHHIVHDLWLCFVVVLWHSSLETKGLQLGICWCPWWNFDHWRCRRNCTGWTTIPRSLLKGIHPKNTHYIWGVWGWLLRGPHLKGKIFPPFSVWMNCGTEDENDASTLIEADVQFQVMEHIFCSSVYMLDGTSWFFLKHRGRHVVAISYNSVRCSQNVRSSSQVGSNSCR